MTIKRRVAALEGRTPSGSVGEMLDALAAADAGQPVDWNVVRPSPALQAALKGLGEKEDEQ